MELTKADYMKLYKNMILTRKLEDCAIHAISAGRIPGWIHMGRGQEGVGTGGATFLRKDDYLLHTHRGFSHVVGKGCRLEVILAEQYGKAIEGSTGGKGGLIHIKDRSIGMHGVYGSIGGNFVVALGFGLAAQRDGKQQVVAVFFGEGASNRGTFHEAMNLAALWKLPIVWICENNQYAVSAHCSTSVSTANVADRAVGYGIPGTIVDGQDVLAVLEAVQEAVARARKGLGPSLVEAKTYRIRGHFEGDNWTKYRAKEEVEEWEKEDKDPIQRFRKVLLEKKILISAEIDRIDQEATEEIEKADKIATEAADPEIQQAFEDLYA